MAVGSHIWASQSTEKPLVRRGSIFGSHGFIPDILSTHPTQSTSWLSSANSPMTLKVFSCKTALHRDAFFYQKLLSTSPLREKTTYKWGTYCSLAPLRVYKIVFECVSWKPCQSFHVLSVLNWCRWMARCHMQMKKKITQPQLYLTAKWEEGMFVDM